MSLERRRELVERKNPSLSKFRQCALGGSRSSIYCHRKMVSEADLFMMDEIGRQFLGTHFYGPRR